MLTLAFDTATSRATVALVEDGEPLGERVSTPSRVLADANELLAERGLGQQRLARLVVGTGPGSFTGIRIGLALARGLAFALSIPVAGVSTLEALGAGRGGALPVIDAKRREIFTLVDGEPRCLAPDELELERGACCVGDGAVRYRAVLERKGGEVPPDDSALHLPSAVGHVALARRFGGAERLEPLYLRLPDAEARAAR
jgi:tRNA threonylcarbamoyladenosine biosynthesis protein TsaB